MNAPPEDLALPDGEVHVRRTSLDRERHEVERLERILSRDERARARRYRFARDADRFVVGRAMLRNLLGRYLSGDPAGIRLETGPQGKPRLRVREGRRALEFSLSRSDDVALLAFARGREVGVDIERIREIPELPELCRNCLAPREIDVMRALPESDRIGAFYSCWTRKEAYVKGLGVGLSIPLERIEVSVAPTEPRVLSGAASRGPDAGGWRLYDLDVGVGFAGALAVSGGAVRIRLVS